MFVLQGPLESFVLFYYYAYLGSTEKREPETSLIVWIEWNFVVSK